MTAIDQHFGDEIDYGVIVKLYGDVKPDGERMTPVYAARSSGWSFVRA